MPQMAPMSWVMLMVYFITIFIMFNTMNYFSFKYPVKTLEKMSSQTKINWKW